MLAFNGYFQNFKCIYGVTLILKKVYCIQKSFMS